MAILFRVNPGHWIKATMQGSCREHMRARQTNKQKTSLTYCTGKSSGRSQSLILIGICSTREIQFTQQFDESTTALKGRLFVALCSLSSPSNLCAGVNCHCATLCVSFTQREYLTPPMSSIFWEAHDVQTMYIVLDRLLWTTTGVDSRLPWLQLSLRKKTFKMWKWSLQLFWEDVLVKT